MLLLAPAVAHADVFVPPGEHMGPDSSHHALGLGLSLGLEKEGFSPAASLRFQAGAEKEHPYFRAALTAAPLEHRYGAELGTSLHLGGLRSPIWRRDRLTLDAVLTVEDGRLVPALAPGLSVAWLAAGGSGRGWGEVGLGLRAVLPPWHWEAVGPRLELSVTVLFGLHAWPRGADSGPD
jgi:hypothetical protein